MWQSTEHVILTSKARGADYTLLLVIAHRINETTHVTWTSEVTLAEESRLSLRQVRYSLKSLERHKEVLIYHSRGRGRSQVFALPGKEAELAAFVLANEANHNRKSGNPQPEKRQITTVKEAASASLGIVGNKKEKKIGDDRFLSREQMQDSTAAYSWCTTCNTWHQPGPCP
jgi:hypothetical protein